MLKKQNQKQRSESGVVLHINLLGAIVFSLALVMAAAMVTYAVSKPIHSRFGAGMEVDRAIGPEPARFRRGANW